MKVRTVPTTEEQERFYAEGLAELQKVCDRYPNIRTKEMIAIFSRAVGYMLAMCEPVERESALQTARENMTRALDELAPVTDKTASGRFGIGRL